MALTAARFLDHSGGMSKVYSLLIFMALFAACTPATAPSSADDGDIVSETAAGVVYGDDSRRDPNPRGDGQAFKRAQEASVALIRPGYLKRQKNGSYLVAGKNIKRDRNLCPEVRFNEQPSVSYCSGTLIAPNKVLTAGHCVESGCDDIRFVFGWNKYNPKIASSKNVYKCRTILMLKTAYEDLNDPDVAVIELDRKVVGRRPIDISFEPLKVGEDVFVAGYPSGLPLKFSTAKIRKLESSNYMRANSDTFSGDSGAPVFSKDGKLKGILIGGEEDYVEDEKRGCKIINQCKNDDCRGEDVLLLNTQFTPGKIP